jgi:hypothetical protein
MEYWQARETNDLYVMALPATYRCRSGESSVSLVVNVSDPLRAIDDEPGLWKSIALRDAISSGTSAWSISWAACNQQGSVSQSLSSRISLANS